MDDGDEPAIVAERGRGPAAEPLQVVQLGGYIYPYYSTVGAGTAGYPLMDSQTCPNFSTSNPFSL